MSVDAYVSPQGDNARVECARRELGGKIVEVVLPFELVGHLRCAYPPRLFEEREVDGRLSGYCVASRAAWLVEIVTTVEQNWVAVRSGAARSASAGREVNA